MAALRLTSSALGTSKQIAKVIRGNFRVSASFRHQVSLFWFNKNINFDISSVRTTCTGDRLGTCEIGLLTHFNDFSTLLFKDAFENAIQESNYLPSCQRNDVRCQWNPITVFSRGFRTSQILGINTQFLFWTVLNEIEFFCHFRWCQNCDGTSICWLHQWGWC